MTDCCVIVAAAGIGRRMGAGKPKQFIMLDDKPILVHTLLKIADLNFVDKIILVTGKHEIEFCQDQIVKKYNISKVDDIIAGGDRRQDSVHNGLVTAKKYEPEYVLIHDGVRPLFTKSLFERIFTGAKEYSAAIPGLPVVPTVKQIDSESFVQMTVPREKIWEVQTPQGFLYSLILRAYDNLYKKQCVVTDESMAVELIGEKVKIIKGEDYNIKITNRSDLNMARQILNNKGELF